MPAQLGFLGTGTITAAIVTGLNAPDPGPYSILLSPRNAAVAYQGHVALVPRSALRMRPHPGIVAVPVSGMDPSTAAVAMPAMGYDPAAAALADVATGIAREHIGTIEDARLPAGLPDNAGGFG